MLENNAVFKLIVVIVNRGKGSLLLSEARKLGISGGTILLGKGTKPASILNFFTSYEEEKEIVIFGTLSNAIEEKLKELNKTFRFEKPNHGIVFVQSACAIVGSSDNVCGYSEFIGGNDRKMYQSIMAIVERGVGEDVIEAANSVGSKGGTIINARGAGKHETTKVFNMEIEPEKEIVLIISETEKAQKIVDAINKKIDIEKPGHVIIFVQNLDSVYGIIE